jgi:ABC-type transport system substrate-binding protein
MTRLLFASLLLALVSGAHAADPAKVLRIASPDIDTLDPQNYTDDPSFQIIQALFEPAYEWDYLASPPKLTPLTAEGPPEITDNEKTWTIHLKHGIYFIDDPAFKGKPRELTADDYVYSYKRWLDPNGRRGGAPILTNLIVGARPVIDQAAKAGKFDFDRPIEGLRALDRYTLQIRLNEPNYPNVRDLLGFNGACAREVVEAAGPDLRTRPVGTGPFRLREWKRGSRLVLEANPQYRKIRFPESTKPSDAALVRSMQKVDLPQIGVIDVSIIDEDLTRLLEFQRGGLDLVVLRGEVATRLLADNKLRAEEAARGVTRSVLPEPFAFFLYLNVADPTIGGMSNERVALRRAIALAFDTESLVKIVYAGQGLPANQIVPPGVGGHDPASPPKSLHDPATAKALLDRFGYKVGADGFRTAPDGKPLTLTLSQRSGAISREIETLFKKNMDAVALRTAFRQTPFQEVIKELERGKFQLYYGGFGGSPSGYAELQQLYSKAPQRINVTQFKLAEYDRAMEQFLKSADDEVQIAAARTMSEIARTYMPEMPAVYRLENFFVHGWVRGFAPPIFTSYWKYLDIDLAQRRQAADKAPR